MSKLPVTENQFRNILAFAALLVGEKDLPDLLNRSPAYIIEKFTMYLAPPELTVDDIDTWRYGIHPTLQKVLDAYILLWADEFNENPETDEKEKED